jgi:transcriptional regulator with XRE-family HTH domain
VGRLPTHPAELPLRQLAHALVQARRDTGCSAREAARRLDVPIATLRAWEHGRARPGWEELAGLSEVYGEHLAARLREREPVVLDRERGVLRVGDRVASFDPAAGNDAVLRLYLRRVRELRGLRRGARFPLRDDDIAALALVVDVHDAALEDRLVALMGIDRGEAGLVRRRLVAAAAVAVVGGGVAGGLALARDGGAPDAPASVATARAADTGPAADAPADASPPTTGDDVAIATTAPSAPASSTPAATTPSPVTTAAPAPVSPPTATTTAPATPPPTAATDAAGSDAPADDAPVADTAPVDTAPADPLASTTPPVPVTHDDPPEAFTDATPPAPVSHDDPPEAFAPAAVAHDDPPEAFAG